MKRMALALAFLACLALPAAAGDGEVEWTGWSDQVFARARQEGRLVLLDLEAVWCHWCHVMDETTYRNPKVTRLLREHFVCVKVDQDARPDLANRYEDYGWPATILFDSSGRELAKLSGYQPPDRMASLLQAFVDDPTPGPSAPPTEPVRFAATGSLPEDLRAELHRAHAAGYDRRIGGWGSVHRFLNAESVEYCLDLAAEGDREAEAMARQTLESQLALLDPVWGGAYQYSHGAVWTNPHFEKIMPVQVDNLRLHSLAWATFRDPEGGAAPRSPGRAGAERHLAAARSVHRYLRDFLRSPEGAFYGSQDADVVPGRHSEGYFALGDAARRSQGIPRVDTHLYARENGLAIQGLVALFEAAGDVEALDDALRAARWVVARRSLPGGGFRHDEEDRGGPYLADTLACGRAFLALYSATGDREWLERALQAADFLDRTFALPGQPGYATALPPAGLGPTVLREENCLVARFANLLRHYSGQERLRSLTDRAMAYATTPELAREFNMADVLLADFEVTRAPLHVTVVGPREDARTRALLAAARARGAAYRRIESWDPREGPPPNPDVEYPVLDAPAAFVCGDGRCSRPAFEARDLEALLDRRATTPGG